MIRLPYIEEELQNTLQNSLQNNTQESNKKEINTKFINDTDATLKTLLIIFLTHISYGSGKVRSNDRLPYIVIQLIKGIYSNKSFLSFIVANDYLNLLNHSENTLQNNTLQNNSLQNILFKSSIVFLNKRPNNNTVLSSLLLFILLVLNLWLE
ncbi:hypothetical protein ABK040_014644 [Willaertia magna]